MLRCWIEYLPLCVVRWLALRWLGRMPFGDRVVVQARPDVLIVVKED